MVKFVWGTIAGRCTGGRHLECANEKLENCKQTSLHWWSSGEDKWCPRWIIEDSDMIMYNFLDVIGGFSIFVVRFDSWQIFWICLKSISAWFPSDLLSFRSSCISCYELLVVFIWEQSQCLPYCDVLYLIFMLSSQILPVCRWHRTDIEH